MVEDLGGKERLFRWSFERAEFSWEFGTIYQSHTFNIHSIDDPCYF
jgi:hypothetical protein